MNLYLLTLVTLSTGLQADYDYRGRDYVEKKAEKLVFGLWMITDYDTIYRVIDDALAAGYRTFDTAQAYNNEEITGRAFNALLPKHGLKREDIFLSSKVHNIHQGPKAEPSIIESLEKLNFSYLDLMLIHWPGAMPVDWSNPLHNMTNRRGTWKALEKYYNLGKLRSIGVSNWMRHHLEDLLSYATVNSLVDYCQEKGIIFQAYACNLHLTPEKAIANYRQPKIEAIAKKYDITPKLLQFVFPLNRGMSVLTRATTKEHILENRKANQIKMNPEDIEALMLKGTIGHKNCGDPKFVTDSATIKEIVD
ncbi:unnamed protein product, partial [Mesorhabditis belari]|uniref:NADP-dependent oxidoreductase domain-containing protein n=1 Tax=Mesorhabditis belari TaxID=2138241 RepID=A0AAF3EVF7_9BILA